MRRDVRMGFAVGGVLLAVIIVAFLAIHRNHNKPVAFDKGAGEGSADTTSVDVNAPESGATRATPPPPGAVRDSTAAKLNTDKSAEPRSAADEKVENDRWDALFASTGPNPAQNQLSRGAAKNAPKPADRNSRASAKPLALLDNAPAPADAQPAGPADSTQPNLAPVTGVRSHTIQPNETLSGISKLVYGSSRHYKAIEAANPGVDATKLRPGMVLKIPTLDKAKQVVKQQAADATSAADGKTYTVQKDDNLYKITRKLYGNGEKQEALYELNKSTIGPDSTKLKPGMVLKLPAAPAAQ